MVEVIDNGAGWKSNRRQPDEIEVFTSPTGVEYVQARADETPDVKVLFTRTPGLPPLLLVRAENSVTITRANRKARRAMRELTKRGL